MKKIKIFAFLLILAFAFSMFTACEFIGGTPDTPDVNDETNGDENKNPGNNDIENPDGGNNEKPTECVHNWVHEGNESVCSKCNKVCEHRWVSGTCGDCDRDCNHQWQGGVCSVCGVDCTHLWGEGGICVYCGDECEHNFKNGECTVCHKACQHVWADGVCTVCNKACEHDFDPNNDYTCTICGEQALVPPECKHSWNDGVCVHCGDVCKHKWDNGYCPVCTLKCDHQFDGDTCTVCGFQEIVTPPTQCEHSWVDGFCDKCGNSCEHKWNKGVCEVCGKICDHNFGMGYCYLCGEPCDHTWNSDSLCTKCGLDCRHESWSDGFCTECNKECLHQWTLEKCDLCGLICNHTFEGATCTKCGYSSGGIDNPICVTFNGVENYVPYSAFFADLFYLADLGFSSYDESILNGYWVAITEGGDVEINEYTALSDFGHHVTIEYRTHGAGECEHTMWADGVCEGCGLVCKHETYISGCCAICHIPCEHIAFTDGMCNVCGFTCSHYFYEGECQICGTPCDHSWILSEDNTYCSVCNMTCYHQSWAEGSCTQCAYACKHSNVWYDHMCVVCGVVCEHNFFDNICEWCGVYCEHPEWYNGKCVKCDKCEEILPPTECTHDWKEGCCNICGEICYHENWSSGICQNCNKQCDHSWQPSGYCNVCNEACEHGFFEGTCLTCGYMCEHTFHEGVCEKCGMQKENEGVEGIEFCIEIQEYPGSDIVSTYNVVASGEMSLMDIFYAELKTVDGAPFSIPYEYNFLIRLNGKALNDEELYSAYITNGCHIFIYRCYTYDIETVVNGEINNITHKSPYMLSGAELLHTMGLGGISNYNATVNGMWFDPYSFESSMFPLDGYNCHIQVESLEMIGGMVRLEVLQEGNYQYSFDAEGELRLEDCVGCDPDTFDDFIWSIQYPDGTVYTLENLDLVLTFNQDFIDPTYGATVYRVDMKLNIFIADLVIDDVSYGNKEFRKTDNLTVRDIINSFGIAIDFEIYDWMFTCHGTYVEGLDDVVTEDIYITAYDRRPYIELSVDGVSYKYNHNETLTLADAISIINNIHGTSFTFDGYIWYGYSNDSWKDVQITDPLFVVVESGYSRTVTAKTHDSVNVYFETDFGPLGEDGMMPSATVFKKDSVWSTPEMTPYILEMAKGVIVFTGEYEYRTYNKSNWEIIERHDINSIEELFALNLEEVALYAKYEVNYEKLCGTYVKHDQIVFITESTITTFDKWNNAFSMEQHYNIELSAYMISLVADDRSFSYSYDYFSEYSKIEDGAFGAVVYNTTAGFVEIYRTYDEYLMYIEGSNVDSVTDRYGNDLGAVGDTGLYFVYISEKTES